MKRFTIWMREVLPPKWLIILMAFCYLMSIAVPQLVLYYFDLYEIQEETGLLKTPLFCLGMFAIIFGLYRSGAFHPIFQNDYREWLAQTPWSHEKPLPRGPVYLVAQDFLILCMISSLSYFHDPELWLITPSLFLIAHSLMCLMSFILTQEYRYAYVITFLLPSLLYLYESPGLSFISVAIIAIISHWGLRKAMRTFDKWSGEQNHFLQTNSQLAKEMRLKNILGWPHDSMGPISSPKNPTLGWAIALALQAGWWSFSVILQISDRPEFLSLIIGIGIGLWVCSFIPTSRCLSGHAPPINFWGRMRTGRWIIPSYDKIFLSPLVVSCCLTLATCMTLYFPQSLAIIFGVAATFYVFFTIYFTPDLDEWRLTGNHCIHPGFGINKTELVQTQ